MKTLRKVLQYKVWIIMVVVTLLAANLFTVGYSAKYWKTNRDYYNWEVSQSPKLQADMISTICFLMAQDHSGKKDIWDTLSTREIKENLLGTVEKERQEGKCSEVDYGYLKIREWISGHPNLTFYIKNHKTGNVITNAAQIEKLETERVSDTNFAGYDFLYKFTISGTECDVNELLGSNYNLGVEVALKYGREYKTAINTDKDDRLTWTYPIMPELAKNQEYTIYLGTNNFRTLDVDICEVDEEYDLFALLWFYFLEILIILVGSRIVSRKPEIKRVRYNSLEGPIIGITLVCVLIPMIVIVFLFNQYDQSQNYLWNLGLFLGLLGSLYAANILGQMRENGIRQELAEKTILGRYYVKHKKRMRRVPTLNIDEKRKITIRLLIAGIIYSFAGSIFCLIGFDIYRDRDEFIAAMMPIICIIYLVVVWFFWFRKSMHKEHLRYYAYHVILQQAKAMADGQLENQISEDLGEMSELGDTLNHINDGLKKAVEEAVTSQSMKTELITNVSHDLKTPLTSIVSYVDLLKRTDLTDQEKMEFIEILEQKSARLKTLIEDLFEMSKAASKDIKLTVNELNIVSLTKEVLVEYEKALDEKNLKVNMSFISENIKVHLDGQKTYRIIANLVGNIVKYTMPHTRVYVMVTKDEEHVILEFKNISATEITHQGKELLERFVREDASRNTEGSGLGLAIAKSLAELQNGTLDVEADGDLFKATVTFPLATEE